MLQKQGFVVAFSVAEAAVVPVVALDAAENLLASVVPAAETLLAASDCPETGNFGADL